MREDQHRLGDVANGPLGQARLIVVDERDDVTTGDIAIADDREAAGVEIERDSGDLPGRNRRTNSTRVQEIRKRQVVDVPRRARNLFAAFLAENVASDGPGHAGLYVRRLGRPEGLHYYCCSADL